MHYLTPPVTKRAEREHLSLSRAKAMYWRGAFFVFVFGGLIGKDGPDKGNRGVVGTELFKGGASPYRRDIGT